MIPSLLMLLLSAVSSEAAITLKGAGATNPSNVIEQTVLVKSHLPSGIQPENVLDLGGMNLGYDAETELRYVYKEVTLQPGESVSYEVQIEDIWLVDEQQLEEFTMHAAGLTKALEDTEHAEVSLGHKSMIDRSISAVRSRQDASTMDKVKLIEHMSAHRRNNAIMHHIEKQVGMLEDMVIRAGRDPGKILGRSPLHPVPEGKILGFAGSGVTGYETGMGTAFGSDGDGTEGRAGGSGGTPGPGLAGSGTGIGFGSAGASDAEGRGGGAAIPGNDAGTGAGTGPAGKPPVPGGDTVVFKITAENPSEIQAQSVSVHKYLYKEVILSDDVLDTGGLALNIDFEKSLLFVHKEDVILEPKEKRIFNVVLRNKWSIDKNYLLSLKNRTTDLRTAFEALPSAQELCGAVIERLDGLLQQETSTEHMDGYVDAYRLNKRKLEAIERDIQRLEDVFGQAQAAPKAVAVTGLKGLGMLRGTMFEGMAPGVSTTWTVIWIILAFLGLISILFFLLWWVQAKKSQGVVEPPE